jgi:hypothetical protein
LTLAFGTAAAGIAQAQTTNLSVDSCAGDNSGNALNGLPAANFAALNTPRCSKAPFGGTVWPAIAVGHPRLMFAILRVEEGVLQLEQDSDMANY